MAWGHCGGSVAITQDLDGYVSKPINADELFACVNALVGKDRSHGVASATKTTVAA